MAFEELKAKQSVVWGSGPYERISEHLTLAHDHLLARVEPRGGERWLDVATGTGEIAVRAAAAGASVVGLDLAPALIETARRRMSQRLGRVLRPLPERCRDQPAAPLPARPRDPRGVVTEVHRIAVQAVSWVRGVQAPAESDGS